MQHGQGQLQIEIYTFVERIRTAEIERNCVPWYVSSTCI